MTGPASASADPSGGRSSRLLGSPSAGRGVVASLASTIVVFGVLGWLIVHSPNWEDFRAAFFDTDLFLSSLPKILHAFWINVQLFLVCEVLILGLGLVIAVMRVQAATYAASLGLKVNAGHGLTYHNVKAVAALPEMHELNIGHAIIGRAVMTGLKEAVAETKRLMLEARG